MRWAAETSYAKFETGTPLCLFSLDDTSKAIPAGTQLVVQHYSGGTTQGSVMESAPSRLVVGANGERWLLTPWGAEDLPHGITALGHNAQFWVVRRKL